jgi:hypothetical protein
VALLKHYDICCEFGITVEIATPVVAKMQLQAEKFGEAGQCQLKMMFICMGFCLYKGAKSPVVSKISEARF